MPLLRRDKLTLTSWQLRAFEVGGMHAAGLNAPAIAKKAKLTQQYVERLLELRQSLIYFPTLLTISNVVKAYDEMRRLKYDDRIEKIKENT
jgi:hypothetical protein